MTTYALVHATDGDTGRRCDFQAAPPDLAPEKGLTWLPLQEQARPAYDPATQRLEKSVTVTAQAVTVAWAVVDLAPAELDARAEARIDAIDVEVLKAIFDLENRMRVQEGRQQITAQQFRTALKNRLG